MTKMLPFLFRLLVIALLSPRVFSLFFIKLRGCSYDRFTLVYVLTSKTVFTSLLSNSTLLASETNIVVL